MWSSRVGDRKMFLTEGGTTVLIFINFWKGTIPGDQDGRVEGGTRDAALEQCYDTQHSEQILANLAY